MVSNMGALPLLLVHVSVAVVVSQPRGGLEALHQGHHVLNRAPSQRDLEGLQTRVTGNFTVDDKVWLFAVSGRRRPYIYQDDTGKLGGFYVDFVSRVCAIANKRCKLVLAEFHECTFTERNINYPGRGLMSGWFDGCMGYVVSRDRLGAFDFTKPYLSTGASFAVVSRNSSHFSPDLHDFSNFTITHLNGAVTNAQCLTRLGKAFGQIRVAENLPVAKALLLNGSADVIFSPRSRIPDLETFPQRFHCELEGTGIVLKKGSEVSHWWNPAFDSLVRSGEFTQLCLQGQTKYKASKPLRCLQHLLDRQPSPASNVPISSQNRPGERVWLFATSGRRKPFSYLNDEGDLVGFNVDFVQAVCAEAGRACETVLSAFTECSYTERNTNYAGRGLMDGWFDACPGYSDSIDRDIAVDFTDAFLQTSSRFAVLPGNPSGFDPTSDDLTNFTITHLTGAYTNEQCLRRLNKTPGTILISPNLPEAKRLLFNRQADAIFAPRSSIPDLEVLPEVVHCERTGSAIMTKRGSPLVDWWNVAFRAFVAKGDYHRLCEAGRVKYNYPIKCFPREAALPTRPTVIDQIIG